MSLYTLMHFLSRQKKTLIQPSLAHMYSDENKVSRCKISEISMSLNET